MPVHYHYLSAYGGYYGGAGSTEMARKRAATIGLGQKIAKPATGGYNRSWDTTLPVSDYPSSDFNDGLVKLPLWAMVGGYGNAGMFTNGTNHPVYQSYTLLDGAWGMGGMSNCLLGPGASMLNRGAVAWSGCTYEPFVAALLNPEEFMNCILQGLSMMEAAAHSNMVGGWMASTWGDPLYRPFGKQNTTLIG